MTATWNVWRGNPPPISTWVWATFRYGEKPILVQTCKRGCCVHWRGETMILPSYWQPATDDEIKRSD